MLNYDFCLSIFHVHLSRFHKSIIRSRSAMTYEAAQNRIDDVNDDSAIAASLRILLKLSKILKNRRVANGALVLASSEVRFNVDSETADPIDVQAKVVRETNSMVEEFMLAANISAAERIYKVPFLGNGAYQLIVTLYYIHYSFIHLYTSS